MPKLKFTNIFEAFTDDAQEAADLEFRADLMLLMREYFRAKKSTQAEIGRMLGIPQPRVSELMTGKIDKFSSDKLIGLLSKLGIRLKPTFKNSTANRASSIKCTVSVVDPY